jgi:hypothetical protein
MRERTGTRHDRGTVVSGFLNFLETLGLKKP